MDIGGGITVDDDYQSKHSFGWYPIVNGPLDGGKFLTNPKNGPEDYLWPLHDTEGRTCYYEYDRYMHCYMFRGIDCGH